MPQGDLGVIGALLNYAGAVIGIASFLGAVAVVWLSTKFPRRQEFYEKTLHLRRTAEALEHRIDANDILEQQLAGELKVINERLKSVDEKISWRLGALDNQVTILLRGHMEWEER